MPTAPERNSSRATGADEHGSPGAGLHRPAQRAQFQASGRFDRTARLSEIAQPALVVHGRADRIVPVELAREMHAAIPGARLTLLNGGHLISLMPHRQAPFVAAVREFLPPGQGTAPAPEGEPGASA